MAQSVLDKIPPGPKLDALTAEKVFGWKNIHKREGTFVGKKQVGAGSGVEPRRPTIPPTPSMHIR
jgi:hypothetical protein